MMREKPEIVEIISQYVQLRKAGREFVGLCPFHAEKTPSFFVNPDKQVFYCHGCHEGGDSILFLQKIKGISFSDVLQELGLKNDLPSPPPAIPSRQWDFDCLYDREIVILAAVLDDMRLLAKTNIQEAIKLGEAFRSLAHGRYSKEEILEVYNHHFTAGQEKELRQVYGNR